jgi:hypothetical protein
LRIEDSMDPDDAPPPPARPPFPLLAAGLVAAAAALAALGLAAAGRAGEAADRARVEAEAASRNADRARDAAERMGREIADLRSDLDILATSVDAVQRQIKELADAATFGGGAFGGPGTDPSGPDAPPAQPAVEFTPELREALRKAVADKGIDLLEDRVVLPGSVVLREGALEFFAVFPGGKTHESVLLLEGKPDAEGNRAQGLGAALNSCLMALGLRPGTPVRVLPGGRALPAKGSPVHLAVEWEEEGKPVRVRAEDLLWDRERNRAMDPGRWIYVGSFFDPQGYLPDLTGDAVAVWSVATCIVDLDDPRAANDTIFVACKPRIPPEGTKVRLVLSPKPLEPTRTWPEGAAPAGDAAPAPAEGAGGK